MREGASILTMLRRQSEHFWYFHSTAVDDFGPQSKSNNNTNSHEIVTRAQNCCTQEYSNITLERIQ